MIIKIIGTGSKGNCVLIQDLLGNELMLDCGLKYDKIISKVNIRKLNGLFVTHRHQDHIKSLADFKRVCFNIYTPDKLKDGQIIDIENWKIVVMEVPHDVPCFGFLIFNKNEKKKIAYMTDCTKFRKIGYVDIMLGDCNYCQEIVNETLAKGERIGSHYYNHMSIENVKKYLDGLEYKIPKFVAFHISNSGLNSYDAINKILKDSTKELFIAKNDLDIVF